MNNPDNSKKFRPPQALAPTPQLYDELVGDGMENLAKATVSDMPTFKAGSVVLDDGCGTGAGTAAVVDAAGKDGATQISIKGVDINEAALEVYKKKAAENQWPAEGIKADAGKLDDIADSTFTHAIGTAFLFVLPEDGVPAMKEIYRTLKPGGAVALNSWAYVPNMGPVRVASSQTRPEGTPEIRDGLDKWSSPSFLKGAIEKAGFSSDAINLTRRDIYVTTTTIDRYATMLWSFIGGTTAAGWLESDEDKWDEAVEIVKDELRKTDGFEELDGGRMKLKFVANIAVATK
jgi:ubiquinone/menaquinone biosynthesis C-methylase UbiE